MTGIQWTDQTWNPATGCSKVSPGCKNCYADVMAGRLMKMGQKKYKNGFIYTEHPDALTLPQKWKKPRMVFVNSMSDLFHENATDSFINEVFEIMMGTPRHIYQILTKRPERMEKFVKKFIDCRGGLEKIPKHIWLGTSVESQEYTNRIEILKRIPAVKFVSFEPLLGEIHPDLDGIHWAIVGGESGRGHRPIQRNWVDIIQTACEYYGVKFFFKQWGGITPKSGGDKIDGMKYQNFPDLEVVEY